MPSSTTVSYRKKKPQGLRASAGPCSLVSATEVHAIITVVVQEYGRCKNTSSSCGKQKTQNTKQGILKCAPEYQSSYEVRVPRIPYLTDIVILVRRSCVWFTSVICNILSAVIQDQGTTQQYSSTSTVQQQNNSSTVSASTSGLYNI